ncbi:glycine--tRNA ligase subunit beta [Sulfurospirillum sp. 1612]|uniref:glycine--tRNA ligase subunit beta n=1 Tax=Sulfurospirillum sp. 1612 TaxID=3094835 RepID=UPI002F95E247
MTKPLLIEVGVEELPAIPFLKELPNIEKKYTKVLESNALLCEFEFYYTPRRLVLWHPEFPLSQEDKEEEFFGAPISIAYKDGVPTPAAVGFAKKCGTTIENLQTANKGGKEVLYFKHITHGEESVKFIGTIVETFLKSLNFGKSMRWGSSHEHFIRPIRWIGCMLGHEIVKFRAFDLESSNQSYPHRHVSYAPFSYDFAGEYFDKLKDHGVMLFSDKRREKILADFDAIEANHNLSIEKDSDLLNEVVAITEHPRALLGSFDEEFLRLPPEVIMTSMKEHQRYFPVFKEGTLTNHFIVVSNAICDNYDLIVSGNEKVLRARLSDALFFYDNDLKNGLDFSGLKDVVFLDGLGTVFDKTMREKSVADYLYEKYLDKLTAENPTKEKLQDLLNRSVLFAKADLLSEMVYEFTELQGLMGYYYAKAAGEDALVYRAIKEQYLPNSEDSELPSTIFSSIIALANKLDSVLALFSINRIPTGTKDPYALRRAVNGIIKIVLEYRLAFDIDKDIDALAKHYKSFDVNGLKQFFLERINQFFDVNASVIQAVLSSGERDIVTLSLKIKALSQIVKAEGFQDSFSTFKRVANIIKNLTLEDLDIETALLQQEEEKNLYARFIAVRNEDYTLYEEKLDALFSLKPEIDAFFDNVMVNVEDASLKRNRQNLIASIYSEFKSIADIKEISV